MAYHRLVIYYLLFKFFEGPLLKGKKKKKRVLGEWSFHQPTMKQNCIL